MAPASGSYRHLQALDRGRTRSWSMSRLWTSRSDFVDFSTLWLAWLGFGPSLFEPIVSGAAYRRIAGSAVAGPRCCLSNRLFVGSYRQWSSHKIPSRRQLTEWLRRTRSSARSHFVSCVCRPQSWAHFTVTWFYDSFHFVWNFFQIWDFGAFFWIQFINSTHFN